MKPQKAENQWKMKTETKNKSNKQKTITNAVDISLIIPTITLNINGLHTSSKIYDRNCQSASKP